MLVYLMCSSIRRHDSNNDIVRCYIKITDNYKNERFYELLNDLKDFQWKFRNSKEHEKLTKDEQIKADNYIKENATQWLVMLLKLYIVLSREED